MADGSVSRRQVVEIVTITGAASLAGCIGGNGNGDGNSSGADGGNSGVEEEQIGGEDASIVLRFDSWGDGAERQALEEGISEFAEANDDISVNYQNVPYDDYHDRLQTQFGAGEEPDAFYIDSNYVSSFASNDVLVNLREELDDEFFQGFDQQVMEAFEDPDGGLYMLPHGAAPLALSYNEELLAEVGYEEFPETWDEFESALLALRDETDVTYPLIEQGTGTRTAWIWYTWVFANGGQIMNDDRTECVVASDECVEALEYFQSLREEDLIGIIPTEIGAEEDAAALAEGQTAIATGGATIPTNVQNNHPDFYEQLNVARPPRPADGEFANLVAGAGFAMSANSEYPDETLAFLQHMLEDGIVPYLESGVSIPTRGQQREEIDLFSEDERYARMVDMTGDPRMGNLNWGPNTQEIYNLLYPQLEGVMQGQVEPRDALETVEEQVNNDVLD